MDQEVSAILDGASEIGEARDMTEEAGFNFEGRMERMPGQTTSSRAAQGVVVMGEAPESDEEEKDEKDEDAASVNSVASVSSVSSTASVSSKPVDSKKKHDKLKYNTLLHKKLRERNNSLRKNIVDIVHQTFAENTKDLNASTSQLLKTQIQMQETSNILRQLTNDLFNLQDKIEVIKQSHFLPVIRNENLEQRN